MFKARVLVAAVALVSILTASVFVPAASSASKSGITLSDNRLDFGECAVGDVCHATVTFTNTTQNELVFDGAPQYAGQFGPEDEFCSGFLSSPARLSAGGFCIDFLAFSAQERKRYRGEACYAFVGFRPACARLVGRGV